jgi:hypothetical protein
MLRDSNGKQMNKWVRGPVINDMPYRTSSVSPLWFAYFPRHVAESKKAMGATLPLALLSRRQYLSRMDRFQHGRSARTLGPEGLEINKKCRFSACFHPWGNPSPTPPYITDRHDSVMFPPYPIPIADHHVLSIHDTRISRSGHRLRPAVKKITGKVAKFGYKNQLQRSRQLSTVYQD